MTFSDTNRLDAAEPRKGWKGRFFHSANMTFAYYAVKAGASVHEHSHSNEEVWNIIDGQLEITIADEVRLVSESELLDAIRILLLDEHVVAEASGAAATAAFLQEPSAYADAMIVLLVTGANVSAEVLRRAVG